LTLLERLAPALFVLIWSTGWIAARYAAPHADPLTFLCLRFAFAFAVVTAIALAARAPWPVRGLGLAHALVSGALLHALYLGGVWWAIGHGLPAGISGLIAGLQPILTALLAPGLVGERIGSLQWAGIGVGFAGIALVLQPGLAGLGAERLAAVLAPIGVNVGAMLAVTLGTFYQKRYLATGDLRAMTALQYLGALIVLAPIAYALEPGRLDWNATTILVMAWSVLGLSVGAIGFLLLLIRRGAVSRTAALIYLVPPTVAIEAALLFGETLSALQVAGVALTAAGVALATRRAAPAA